MASAQTEARASLWVPAKPEHAKIGWTYDFEQTERIARAAHDSAGYDAVMEVVEFVMAEADRRHATALAAKDAELEREKLEHDVTFQKAVNYSARLKEAEAKLAEANKALEPFARIADDYTDEEDDDFQVWKDFDVLGATLPLKHFRAARRAREQGGENNG